MPPSALVYHLEPVRPPLKKGGKHLTPGVCVIGVYDYETDRYRTFGDDQFDLFKSLCDERAVVTGWGITAFDNPFIKVYIELDLSDKTFDLWVAVLQASGGEKIELEPCSAVNGGPERDPPLVPAWVQWGNMNFSSVFDECLRIVWITRRLIDQARRGVPIACPKTGQWLQVKVPF